MSIQKSDESSFWHDLSASLENCDPLPWWATILRWFGWSVGQEFMVMQYDHQKTVIAWTTGMPTRKDALDLCDTQKGQWVRRSIEVWRDQ